MAGVYINDDDPHKPLPVLFTCKEIQPNEELTFSYLGRLDDDEKVANMMVIVIILSETIYIHT